MGKIAFNCFLIFFLFFIHNSIASKSKTMRGMWVVRHDLITPERIDSLLHISSKNEFTDLFVQIRGRGDAYYNSDYEPRAENLPEDFDPLGYLLQESANFDFRVHAWINVFYLWSNDELPKSNKHLVHLQPDWIVYPANYSSMDVPLKKRIGDSEGLYHSPLLPEVQNHIKNVISDILSKYDVDGLHLDYIRYPGSDFDFHPRVRALFRKRYILDPLEFKNNKDLFVEKFGVVGYELYYNRWTRFLKNGLSDFVKSISKHVKQNYPELILSAAVKADLSEAHYRFYQEWDRWLKEGWVNIAIPMNYSVDNMDFLSRIRIMFNSGMMDKLWIGISLYNQPAKSAIEKIKKVEELSLSGYVLFSYSQFKKDFQLRELYLNNVITKKGASSYGPHD